LLTRGQDKFPLLVGNGADQVQKGLTQIRQGLGQAKGEGSSRSHKNVGKVNDL
jgi:hypothetical protein